MNWINHKICRLARLQMHLFPLLIWLAVVGVVIGLFMHRSQRFEAVGLAQGQIRHISSPTEGLLNAVYVDLFQEVKHGQIIAVLDDSVLNAQMDTISAEIDHLMSELALTKETLLTETSDRRNDWNSAQRNFFIDIERTKLRMLELKTTLETDRVTLADLDLEVKIAQDLFEKQAVAKYDLQKAQSSYNVLAKKIEENEQLMQKYKEELDKAEQRLTEFSQSTPYNPEIDSVLEPIRKEMAVQEKLFDELLAQRRSLTITSPIDGIIVQIQGNVNEAELRRPGETVVRMPGEVVLAGDTIAVVAETQPREVIAYATEPLLNNIKEKMAVELVKNEQPQQIAKSQVSFVGPVIEQLPVRLRRNPGIPQWGRPFLVKIPSQMKLTPGELVGVRRVEAE